MQDRYAGDVGDFGKYGLLRALTEGRPRLRLGIIWYLVDEATVTLDPKNDGRHISYLGERSDQFQTCDSELFLAMRNLIASGERSVDQVERLKLFAADTVYYSERLPTPRRSMQREDRRLERAAWLTGAAQATRGCDLIFVDPDNGLETPSVRAFSRKSPKYVYFNDLDSFVAKQQSLVIYHHLGRQPHVESIRQRIRECADYLGRPTFALRYRRGTGRAFLIVPSDDHYDLLAERAQQFSAGGWARHFELVHDELAHHPAPSN